MNMNIKQYWTRRSPRPQSGSIFGEYRIEDFVVETRFSMLYSSTNLNDGSKKAVKFIKCIKGREDQIYNEVDVLKKINHPNLLKLEYSQQCDPYVMFVSNYAPFENLQKFTAKYYPDGMPMNVARIVLRQMASAVAYLHSLGIWHRDIKPQNFLVYNTDIKNPYIVLADFGTAKVYQMHESDNHIVGTRNYMPPEMINNFSYTNSVDIWSLGITFYFVLTNQYAFDFPDQGDDDEDYDQRIKSADLNYDLLEELNISYEAIDIVKKCCDLLPECRIKAAEILRNSWVMDTVNKTQTETEISDLLGSESEFELPVLGI